MSKWVGLGLAVSGTLAACSFPLKSDVSVAEAGSPSIASVKKSAVELQATNVTNLYNNTCGKCHGMKGEGGGAGTKSLLTKALYDQSNDKPFFEAIKNGVPSAGMDAYGPTMSDEEIWALVVHIRELQYRGLRDQFGGPKPDPSGVFKGTRHDYRVETVIAEGNGLKTPWGIDWLPDGTMLVTNRPGTMSVVKNGQVIGSVDGLPPSVEMGQGGLLDVAVHPKYAQNGWIYLSLSDPSESGPGKALTKIVRGKLNFRGGKVTWTSQQTIFQASQEFYSGSGVHFGSRIVFDNAGHVFFSIGERGTGEFAQDLARPNGKIYRVNEDGTVPKDNPFVTSGTKNALPAIWSYGHRNPQGLVMGLDGTLWDTEHGPRGGDEVNRIQKAANYGWPLIAHSINYNDSPLKLPWPAAGQNFTLPVFRWLPSTGASGLDVAKGPMFSAWKGDLLAGGLSGANVDRIRIKDDKVIEREELIFGMGRVRDVATAPDGSIYVALNQPDKIVRIVQAKEGK
jgi:glucose/arabinose dehydrogenase/cytochrome c553